MKELLNTLAPEKITKEELTKLEAELDNVDLDEVVVTRFIGSQKPTCSVSDSALSDAVKGKFHISVNFGKIKICLENKSFLIETFSSF